MSIREEDVAELRMAEVSTISAMKVDRPSAWQSEAPILTWLYSSSDLLKDFSPVVYTQEVDVLTKTESTTDNVAESAGTKDPHWAIRTAQPTLLR